MKKGSLKATLALAATMAFGSLTSEVNAQQTSAPESPDNNYIVKAQTSSCIQDDKELGLEWIVAPSASDLDSLTTTTNKSRDQLAMEFLQAAVAKLDDKADELFSGYTLEEIEAQSSDPNSPFRAGLNAAIKAASAELEAETGVTLLIGSLKPIGVAPGCTPN